MDHLKVINTSLATSSQLNGFLKYLSAYHFPDQRTDPIVVVETIVETIVEHIVALQSKDISQVLFEYKLELNHSSVSSMWDEWLGLNAFCSTRNPKFFKGGIQALEIKFKTKWRSSFSGAEIKHFSRLKYIIQRVQQFSTKTLKSNEVALNIFDNIRKKYTSLSVLEKFLKNSIDDFDLLSWLEE
jgi:hypothetical protein